MRKTLICCLSLFGLLLLPAVASATHSEGNGPNQNFARGTAIFDSELFPGFVLDFTIHANATSGPLGQDPKGHWYFRSEESGLGAADVRGEVTCLNVLGNQAGIAGV